MAICFNPPPDLPPTRRSLLSLLSGIDCRATVRRVESWTTFDTPDHRLAQAGLILVRREGEVVIWSADQLGVEPPLARLPVEAEADLPRRAEAWPPGAVRDLLVPLARQRALLPQDSLTLEWQSAERRDEQGKILVMATGHIATVEGRDPRLWLTISALRGYQTEARNLQHSVGLRGWAFSDREPLAELLAAGRPPTAPPWFTDGSVPAQDALRACILRVLADLEVLAQGVIDDIDTEYLHQPRVTLRRLRSLVGQLDGVFVDLDTTRLRTRLATWARCSNELRDLDVWQSDRSHLVSSVPVPLRPALGELIDRLTQERTRAHREVARLLGGALHRRQREEMATLVERARPGSEASTPLKDLAAGRIWKAYRKVAAGIAALDPEGPPSAVHDLRIGFKKLRYLLDACGRFTAPADQEGLVVDLKELQGVLGSFNDASVQFESLRSRAMTPGLSAESLLAVGALLAVLDHRRQGLRQQLDPLMARFASATVRSHYRRLFRPEVA